MSGSIVGLDGKRYPSAWLPTEDRTYLAKLVHQLHCMERLSVRKVLARIQDIHGIARSVGWATGVLKTRSCPGCSGARIGSPEQPAANPGRSGR